MSLSLVSADAILRHPTNNSLSKEVHQFAKTPRFIHPNPECPNAFYTYDSQLSNRKTSFGYGKKSDFTKNSALSPPSNNYQIKTFLDQTRSKGNSFGLHRQKLPDNSYLIPQLHKYPGPGTYDNEKLKYNNLSFTTRPKPVDFIEKKLTYKQSPGPGAYNEIELLNTTGRFSVSKYSDHKYSIINPNSQRFVSIKQSPGPANYTEGDSLNGNWKYLLSHRLSNGSRVFAKTARLGDKFWNPTTNPGPGAYQEISEFGHYGNAKYYHTLQK